jgi:hypothetical protein
VNYGTVIHGTIGNTWKIAKKTCMMGDAALNAAEPGTLDLGGGDSGG